MSFSKAEYTSILNALKTHAEATGGFTKVWTHEPKRAPGKKVTAAFWLNEWQDVPQDSGLDETALRLVINMRIYENMLAEPQDDTDEDIAGSVFDFITRLSLDVTLGGLVKYVDVLQQSGQGLSGTAGYVDQDGIMFRILDNLIPMVVADAWTQGR